MIAPGMSHPGAVASNAALIIWPRPRPRIMCRRQGSARVARSCHRSRVRPPAARRPSVLRRRRWFAHESHLASPESVHPRSRRTLACVLRHRLHSRCTFDSNCSAGPRCLAVDTAFPAQCVAPSCVALLSPFCSCYPHCLLPSPAALSICKRPRTRVHLPMLAMGYPEACRPSPGGWPRRPSPRYPRSGRQQRCDRLASGRCYSVR